jgi:hypothetical protein
MTDAAEDLAGDTAGGAADMPVLPLCCSGAVTLRPVSAATPCSFAVPDPPPDPNDTAVYLNRYLVYRGDPDGWTFDPTTSTIVFTGAACDTIMSGAQDSVVQMLCACSPLPCPGGCFFP